MSEHNVKSLSLDIKDVQWLPTEKIQEIIKICQEELKRRDKQKKGKERYSAEMKLYSKMKSMFCRKHNEIDDVIDDLREIYTKFIPYKEKFRDIYVDPYKIVSNKEYVPCKNGGKCLYNRETDYIFERFDGHMHEIIFTEDILCDDCFEDEESIEFEVPDHIYDIICDNFEDRDK